MEVGFLPKSGIPGRFSAKISYQVHAINKNKCKTHPRSPAFGQAGIVTDFWLGKAKVCLFFVSVCVCPPSVDFFSVLTYEFCTRTSHEKVCIYTCIHPFAGFTFFFLWGVRLASSVISVVCCGHSSLYSSTTWSVYAPPRFEVVSGLVRQDNFMPSRRFREDGLEDL